MGECANCGDEFEVPSSGRGTFTSVSVSYHDDDRTDWAESFCQQCGDDLLAELEDVALSEIER